MPMRYEPIESGLRMEKRLAERLARKKAQLDEHRPLRPGILARLHEDLRVRLTYHSNAIEGNSLTLKETQIVVEEGITIGGHSIREHLEATNHAGAYDLLRQLTDKGTRITIETILELHTLVLHDLNPTAGQFRQVAVYIRGSDLVTPHYSQVPDLMRQWVNWVNNVDMNSADYDPVVRAAIAHHGFAMVHPFEDGNGRVGRLLLNMQLLRDGYAPAFLLRDWKGRYLTALLAADKGAYTPIVNLVGQAVEAGLDFYLQACNAQPDEHYQQLSILAKTTSLDPNYLGLLARQGKLEAMKRGGRWYSTLAAIQTYQEQAQKGLLQRGRPPKGTSESNTP
ncbi:MAG: Fic family protein [Chloroflexi bacterium]|nr:MAG: Fic family protein [Chloroflexota bacterium]